MSMRCMKVDAYVRSDAWKLTRTCMRVETNLAIRVSFHHARRYTPRGGPHGRHAHDVSRKTENSPLVW